MRRGWLALLKSVVIVGVLRCCVVIRAVCLAYVLGAGFLAFRGFAAFISIVPKGGGGGGDGVWASTQLAWYEVGGETLTSFHR